MFFSFAKDKIKKKMRKANVFINTNKKTQQQPHQQRNGAAQHQPQKKKNKKCSS